MTTISSVATRLLAENGLTTTDISLATAEYLIDNAVDYVNMETGTSIADLSGTAETKSLTGTDSEVLAVKATSALLFRAYMEKGPQVGLSGLSVSFVMTDPHYKTYDDIVERCLRRLRTRAFERV